MTDKKPLGKMIVVRADGATKIISVPITEHALGARMRAELHDARIEGMAMLQNLWIVYDEAGQVKRLPQNKRIPCVAGDLVIVKMVNGRFASLTEEEATTLVASMDEASARSKRNKEIAQKMLSVLSDIRTPVLNKRLSKKKCRDWAEAMVKLELNTPQKREEYKVNEDDVLEIVILLADMIFESNKNL